MRHGKQDDTLLFSPLSVGQEHSVQDHTGKDGMLLNLKKVTVHGDAALLGACPVLSVQTWLLVPLPHSSCLQHLLLLLVSWHAVLLQLQWRSLLCFPVWISHFSPAVKAIPRLLWKLHKLRDWQCSSGEDVSLGDNPPGASSPRICPFPCKSYQGLGLILLSSHKFYLRFTANCLFLLCSTQDEHNVFSKTLNDVQGGRKDS